VSDHAADHWAYIEQNITVRAKSIFELMFFAAKQDANVSVAVGAHFGNSSIGSTTLEGTNSWEQVTFQIKNTDDEDKNAALRIYGFVEGQESYNTNCTLLLDDMVVHFEKNLKTRKEMFAEYDLESIQHLFD
jgi:hypothetical protein